MELPDEEETSCRVWTDESSMSLHWGPSPLKADCRELDDVGAGDWKGACTPCNIQVAGEEIEKPATLQRPERLRYSNISPIIVHVVLIVDMNE